MPVTPAAASFPASPVERGRVEDLLKEAYVDGRIDRVEFESRMGAALAAHTRSELTACCAGLAPRATAPRTALVASAAPDGTGLGVLAHLLPFVSWIFGPLLLWGWLTRFQILAEEQALHRRFGDAYADYCRRVRRWC